MLLRGAVAVYGGRNWKKIGTRATARSLGEARVNERRDARARRLMSCSFALVRTTRTVFV